ncbi:Acryloyl-CoA reductase electron transfer subunit beta [Pelotomaculum sp. FP]|uniref:electron transfer flavoprotein subunit alpha/FixB family protein n=1 Tax=Pelotomaculum sp. FP TaxID=261474 RepID=UPI001064CA77|nr:electron transfer flavoprotein subunit alpha/FixB family protein [Pelotomaculum sp. FP]TEB15266.1 Acryloyl-CoA reductase electron transfer subunit beta [Pelotomaculum sp. FP]
MPEQPGAVWIIVEQNGSMLAEVTLELLGKARELAALGGGSHVWAVLLGNNTGILAGELIVHGADKVIFIDDPRLELYQNDTYGLVLTELVKKHRPEIVLFSASYCGSELSATVAAKLETGLAAHCVDLNINDRGELVQVVPAFGGMVLGDIFCPIERPQMASVKPGMFSKPDRDTTRTGEVIKETASILDGYESPLKAVRVVQEQPAGLPLEKAATVVAGGWGVGQDTWPYLNQLAGALSGAVGCTRPALDEGWGEGEHVMIGTSGKTVRPQVYIGFGVSGSTHHIAGMKDSKVIININKDPEAPIFQVSDYGVVADAKELLPLLLKKIREHKGK